MGTRYFKSTDGTFAVTLLKKYRRYFIRYIFEKVPTVPVLGTVIRYFLKEKFCTFWKQYFRWFYALNNDWVSYLRIVVTGIACSVNKSTEKTSSKKSNLHYVSCITPKRVTSLLGPSPRHCAWAIQFLSKKSRNSDELMANLSSIWPAQDLNPWPPAPKLRARHRIGYVAGGRTT